MDAAFARACRWILAPLAFGAGAIHLAMVPAHAREWPAEGIAFAVTAGVQLCLAVWFLTRPSRRTIVVAVAVSLVTIAAWAVTRTVGFPFGPMAGTSEEIGAVDLLCVIFEGLLLVAAGLVASHRLRVPSRRIAALATAAFPSLVVLGLTTAVLASPAGLHSHAEGEAHDDGHVDSGEAHEHPEADAEDAEHAHDAGEYHTHGDEAGTISAEDATADGHTHGPCTEPVTSEQQAAADALVAETRAGLDQFEDFAQAEAAGFVHITPESAPLVHYAQYEWMNDGRLLDPEAPESIMYFHPRNGSDPVLVGAMYFAEAGEPGPQIGGCLTQWHVHDNLCIAPGEGMVGVVDGAGNCPAGSSNDVTQEMLHVWNVDLSTGPFSELAEADRTEFAVAVIEKIAEAS